MSHPLIDFLKTPMAAPETPGLRRMRYSLIVLCALIALGTLGIKLLVGVFGRTGAAAMLVLVIATPIHAFLYFLCKNAADLGALSGDKP